MKTDVIKLIAIAFILFLSGFFLKSLGIAETEAAAAEDSAGIRHLTHVTDDSLTLHAWVSPAAINTTKTRHHPGLVLLLPMMAHTHESYATLVKMLNEAGFETIAFDMRGHGLSVNLGSTTISYADMSVEEFSKMPEDIDSFFAKFKNDHPHDYDYTDVIVIGASIGANTSGLLLGKIWTRGAVLLSPGRDYRGLIPEKIMNNPGGILNKPIYIAASSDDKYSAESSQWLFENYGGPKIFKKYPGQDHGTDILKNVSKADLELMEWLTKR